MKERRCQWLRQSISKTSIKMKGDVYRDYRVHIDFNIDFDQFQFGLDLSRKEEAAKTA